MAPDINSLSSTETPPPQQQSQTATPRSRMAAAHEPLRQQSPHHSFSPPFGNGHITPPHSHSPQATSLVAAAALNAGLQNAERSPATGDLRNDPTFERRRSSIRMSLSLNDPSLPAPGEMAISPAARARAPSGSLPSPTRHARAPSLGELHQELENEQEAQVNRLLGMIRQQQAQIHTLQSQHPANTTAIEDSNPPSDVSRSQTPAQTPAAQRGPQRISVSRHSSSAHISHSPSPSIRAQSRGPHSINTNIGSPALDEYGNFGPSSAVSSTSLRDESAFYQAETQSLTRENQMLKLRIRELERQISDMEGPSGATSHSPVTQSALHTTTSAEAGGDDTK